MTHEQAAQIPGSRRAAKILFAAFIATALTAFIWGFFVANKVRARAKQTDGALRSIAWACLCYAQQGDGVWPRSEEAVIAASASRWPCERVVSAGTGCPQTSDEAMAGTVLPATAAEAFKIVGLEFSKNPTDAPHVNARGNPSGLGTLDLVNGWLTQYRPAPQTK